MDLYSERAKSAGRATRDRRRRWVASLWLLGCLGLSGCVTAPSVPAKAANPVAELAAHVEFLAKPALEGRKPGTYGARLARQYIERRFRAYGLVPWPPATSYRLSFPYGPLGGGENIVGFLPGSDPQLAQELVLVSAHYDHLGKDHRGRVCPGAADNASGVAALLETARQLTQGPRPKRSVLLVAFDCEEEMCFGSFAFCCRPEVQQAKLVGVVNLDILGRDFLEVVPHTLFVTGTEPYPQWREVARRAGAGAGLRVLPIGTDLVGPRGDHVAFESRELPCLFFSSGMYKDYHLPSDTADKLNYDDMARSTTVVVQTVRALAEGQSVRPSTETAEGFAEELRTVRAVMAEVNQRHDQAGVKPEDVEAFKKLAAEAERLLNSGKYDRAARSRLAMQAAGTLAPYLLPGGETGGANQKDLAQALAFLQQFYINHRLEMLDAYHQLVAHLLRYRPGPFHGMPDFHYELYNISDEDIRLTQLGGERYALHVFITPLVLEARARASKWLLTSFGGNLGVSAGFVDCEGTRQELADRCLLALRGERTNALHYAKLSRVLQAVTGTNATPGYEPLLAERLHAGGFRDETEWLLHCLGSNNPDLVLAVFETAKTSREPRLCAAACRLIVDPQARADVRLAALNFATEHKDKAVLLTLCQVLNDHTPAYKKEYVPMLCADYPLAERPDVQAFRPFLEKAFAQSPDARKTIGEMALVCLKQATKSDFGQDSLRWRQWVEGHGK
jgi:hypothetical protein